MLDKAAFRVFSKFKAVKRLEGGFHIEAKYQGKKKLPSGNTVYLYSEKQIADRNRKKAKRLEKLTKSIKSLRSQVKRDLTSKDEAKALTALAVGLMDETAERVGSDASAKGDLNEDGEPHFGVTTWTKKHISFGKGGATIKYTGKSGVKHVKKIKDAGLVKALKKAYDSCEKGDNNCIFSGEKAIKAKDVNAYLKTFSITAKDLRGFHANHGMREALKAVRAKGGKLPTDKKEREKKLKAEWKKALAEVAEDIGHEPATLSNQYLVPGLEDSYLKDGTVMVKLTKTARAIPIDTGVVKGLSHDLETVLVQKLRGLKGPLGNRVLLPGYPFDWMTVDGRSITVYIRLESRESQSGRLVPNGGMGKFPTGQTGVVVFLNGSLPAETLFTNASHGWVRKEIYLILVHELTHASDVFSKGVNEQGEMSPDQAQDNPAYYNNSSEVRAYMREIIEELRDFYDKGHYQKVVDHFGPGKGLKIFLGTSPTWQEVSKFWTDANQRLVIRGVVREVEQWDREAKQASVEPYMEFYPVEGEQRLPLGKTAQF